MPQLTLQSEQAEVHIHVEPDSSSISTVFALAARAEKVAKRLFPALCRAGLQARLAEDLGPRYTREQAFAEGSPRCPDCGGRRAKRKSWRSRQVALPGGDGAGRRHSYSSPESSNLLPTHVLHRHPANAIRHPAARVGLPLLLREAEQVPHPLPLCGGKNDAHSRH
jgi:hypothetical protein